MGGEDSLSSRVSLDAGKSPAEKKKPATVENVHLVSFLF